MIPRPRDPSQRRRRARAREHPPGARTPPGGWYAYGVTAAATLPSWAVEVALTVEWPVGRHPAGFAARDDQAPEGPPALQQRGARAMVLLKAPGRMGWLAGFGEAAAEVEAVAGLRGVSGADGLDASSSGARSRLLMGPPLPGLVPVPAAVARVWLEAAGERGLAAPVRRRRPASGGHASWRAGTRRGGRARELS